MMTVSNERHDPIDAHVGMNIRLRRMGLGISQSALAEHLGLTFQQIQKYESGVNRVSASRLFRAAEYLSCPVSSFFENLPTNTHGVARDPASERAEAGLLRFLSCPGAIQLVTDFPKLSANVQKHIARLVSQLASDGAIDEATDEAADAEGDGGGSSR